MREMAARSSATWLDGFGEWSWPGLTPAAAVADVGPAAWVPSLPLRVEAPVRRAPAARTARPLPRPLRLARLVVLAVLAGATFVLSSGVVHTTRPAAAALSLPLEVWKLTQGTCGAARIPLWLNTLKAPGPHIAGNQASLHILLTAGKQF